MKNFYYPFRTLRTFFLILIVMFSDSALANWVFTLDNQNSQFSCTIPQDTTTHTCDISLTWRISFDGPIGGEPPTTPVTLLIDGQAAYTSSSSFVTYVGPISPGTHSYQVWDQFGELTASYEQWQPSDPSNPGGSAPIFDWSTETHNSYEGDFNDDGELDLFVQPKLSSGEIGIIPSDSNQYYDSTYHQQWFGQHPVITQLKDWSLESYTAVTGNFADDPGDEIILFGGLDYLLMHGDIITPIGIPYEIPNAVVAWDSNNQMILTSFGGNFGSGQYAPYAADLDGDGYHEIILQAQGSGSSLILNRDGSIRQTLNNGYLGIDWSSGSYTMEVGDFNNDGIDDIRLVSNSSSVPNNIAFGAASSGIIESVQVDIFTDATPKTASLAGKTNVNYSVGPNGDSQISVPIAVPAGTAGVTPEITLSYSSSSGNGLLGIGWQMNTTMAVARCGKNIAQNGYNQGVMYNEEDAFCLNGQQLFADAGTYGESGTTYVTELANTDVITSYDLDPNRPGPEQFIVQTKSGDTYIYGETSHSEDAVKLGANGYVHAWYVKRITDVAGNYIEYQYAIDSYEHYLDKILYTGNDNQNLAPYNEINFVYNRDLNVQENRLDRVSGYSAGIRFEQNRLLKQIQVLSNGNVFRKYNLFFELSESSKALRLTHLQECSYLDNCLAPLAFSWSDKSNVNNKAYSFLALNNIKGGRVKTGDIDGNGQTDFIYIVSEVNGDTFKENGWIWTKLNDEAPVKSNHYVSLARFQNIRPIDIGANGTTEWLLGGYETLQILEGQTLSPRGTNIQSDILEDVFVVDLNGDGRHDLLSVEHGNFKLYEQQEPFEITVTVCDNEPGPNACWNVIQTHYFHGSGWSIPIVGGDLVDGFSELSADSKNITLFDFTGDSQTDVIAKLNNVTKDTTVYCNNFEGEFLSARECASKPKRSTISDGHFALEYNVESREFFIHSLLTSEDINTLMPYDINSDGLSDIIYIKNRSWHYRINQGGYKGFLDEQFYQTGAMALHKHERDFLNSRSFIYDQDGDFKAEFWLYSNKRYYIASFNGEKLVHKEMFDVEFTDEPYPTVGDFNADGTSDLLYETATGDWKFFSTNYSRTNTAAIDYVNEPATVQANLIVQLKNSLGASVDFDYSRLTDSGVYTSGNTAQYPQVDLRGPMAVVKSVFTDNGLGGYLQTNYQYEGAKANIIGRGFLGFSKIETEDVENNLRNITSYRQDFPFIGNPKTTEQYSGNILINQSNTTWLSQTTPRGIQAYVGELEEQQWDIGSDDVKRLSFTTHSSYKYSNDGWNNLETSNVVTEKGFSDVDKFEVNTINAYGSTEWEKRYGRLKSSTVTRTRFSKDPLKELNYSDTQTRTSDFSYYNEGYSGTEGFPGLLKTERLNVDNVSTTKVYTYDQWGNQAQVNVLGKDFNPNSGQFIAEVTRIGSFNTYDIQGRFVINTSNAKGFTTETSYDARFGVPLAITGVNDLTSNMEYDELGRVSRQYNIDGTYIDTNRKSCDGLTDCPSAAVYFTEAANYGSDGAMASGVSKVYYDILERKVETRAQGFEGQWLFAKNTFNDKGLLLRKYSSNYGQIGEAYEEYRYDQFNRPISTTRSGGNGTSRIEYYGNETKSVNSISQEDRQVVDASGKRVRVVDSANNSINYRYDALNRITETEDDFGNVTKVTFDGAGNKILINAPDKGEWKYDYNAFGELRRQIDARGVETHIDYDILGRTIRRVDNASQIPGIEVQTSCWNFDSGYKGKNKPESESLYNGIVDCNNVANATRLYSKRYVYDSLGRVDDVISEIRNESNSNFETYVHSTIYDATKGNVASEILPMGFEVRYEYDNFGNLKKVLKGDGSKVYRTINNVDALGNISVETLGNGVVSTKAYNHHTGFLNSIVSTKNNSMVTDIEIGFDAIGNVQYRNDNVTGRNESFEYLESGVNHYNRLTTYRVNNQVSKTYQYDHIGNLKSKSDFANQYVYADNSKPHAVTSVKNNGITLQAFSYDTNGNLTRTVSGSGHIIRQASYSAFEKVTNISKGDSDIYFKYAPSRSRYRRIDHSLENGMAVTHETTYIDRTYEAIKYTGGQRAGEIEHKYYIAGVVITEKEDSQGVILPASEHYLLTDHLGSVVAITDASGSVVNRYRYDPFGKQHEVSLNGFNDSVIVGRTDLMQRGFTGHEMVNSVGIIHMNGRIYDPEIGRFLQADPNIQAPDELQSYNRYSYVLNNPVSMTDPSGYFFKKLFKALAKMPVINTVFQLAMAATCQACLVLYNAMSTYAVTGSLSSALTSAISTAVMPGGVIGSAVVGGLTSDLQGGKFADGFLAAGLGAALGRVANGVKNPVGKVLAGAIIGGTISKITGSKFSNGAYSAAFAAALTADWSNKPVNPEVAQLSEMSSAGYNGVEGDEVGEFKIVKVIDTSDEDGFRAVLFAGPNDQKIVALAGTNFWEWEDWKTNIRQFFGLKSSQYTKAMALGREYGAITYTGHSLGGGLAAAAALHSGGTAVLFNAAGLHSNTIGKISSGYEKITHYHSGYDALSVINTLFHPSVPGKQINMGHGSWHDIGGLCRTFETRC